MAFPPSIPLPAAFTSYIEMNFYGKVTEQSMLESIVNNESFLTDPLKHVALYSDHGIVHGRDIATKIVQVLHQINGLLIPERQGTRLEFMLGYGVMLAYLHDIGMRDFSAFGRAMHPEFAAQLVYTTAFDPLIDLLWQENSGNVAWRLSNLSMMGTLPQKPQQVLREMLALSIAHSKSKVPITLLNNQPLLRDMMQTRLRSDLTYLYHEQQVTKAEQKLASDEPESDLLVALEQQLEAAKTARAHWLKQAKHQTSNPNLDRYYENVWQESFQWLVNPEPELQQLAVDVIDTVRALRCADALRQRGQRFRTSAGYEVFVNQHTANAVYGLRSSDGSKQFLLEGKDPIAAGEANITSCDLDRDGNLRVSFDRGSFSSAAAVEWAVYSAAIVINDIQADVIVSFDRPVEAVGLSVKKQADAMQILVEGVDDNPSFAADVCQKLGQINPAIAHRCHAVTSLQYADLTEVERYLTGVDPAWTRDDQQAMLKQIGRSGQKVDHLALAEAFQDIKIVTVKTGDVLFEADSPGSFVYIPLSDGLRSFPSGGYQATPIQAWMQIGDTAVIKGSVRNARVLAEQPTDLLMIPKQRYLQCWYNPYTVDEFVQLFGGTNGSALERRHLLPAIAVHKKLISKTRRHRHLPLPLQLKTVFKDPEQVAPFITYLEKLDIQAGDRLFHQGDHADAIYFVELGQISIVAEQISGHTKSVQTIESGSLVGDVDFYSQTFYQTTAVAERDSQLYRLTRTDLQRMQQVHPQSALAFSDMLLSLITSRLLDSATPHHDSND